MCLSAILVIFFCILDVQNALAIAQTYVDVIMVGRFIHTHDTSYINHCMNTLDTDQIGRIQTDNQRCHHAAAQLIPIQLQTTKSAHILEPQLACQRTELQFKCRFDGGARPQC